MTLTVETNDPLLDWTSTTVKVTGKLSSNNAIASTSFTVTFLTESDFNALNAGSQAVKPLPLLTASISEFDFTQILTIKFEKPMLIPRDLKSLELASSLTFLIR